MTVRTFLASALMGVLMTHVTDARPRHPHRNHSVASKREKLAAPIGSWVCVGAVSKNIVISGLEKNIPVGLGFRRGG